MRGSAPELAPAPINDRSVPRPNQIPYPPAQPYAQGSIDDSAPTGLARYWYLLRRHAAAILAITFCGTLLGFLIGIPMHPVYRAYTSIEVLGLNEDFMNMKQTSAVTTNDSSYEVSEEQTQVKVLESEALRNRVFAKLDPDGALVKPAAHPSATGWRKLLHLAPPARLSEREQLLIRAAETMQVRATPRTRIVEITVDSTNPELAADFANTLTSEFIQQNLESRWQSTQATSTWLGRELSDARAKLQRSEAALQDYARRSGLIFTADDTNISNEKLQQIQQELSAVTADRIAKQSRFELAQNATPDSLPDVLNDPGLRETQLKLNDLRRQVASLNATYNPEYSKAKRAAAELAVLENAFKRGRADIVARIRNEYSEAVRKEKLLTASYNSQAHQVTGDGQKAIQYNILKREADSNRQLYDTMLQELKQSSIASAMRSSNVRTIDSAALPVSPISPNFKLNSVVGLFSGLLLSFGFVLIRERADRTLQQPGELQFWTRIPELGTIPHAAIEASGRPLYGRVPASSSARAESTRPRMPGINSIDDLGLVALEQKPKLAEAFRAVLTSILFIGEDAGHTRVLVFTSADAADGKTTVVSNIAATLAEIGRKVLIIDADLRRPRIHTIFGLDNRAGLGDILRQDRFDESMVQDLVRASRLPGLDILTSGPPTHAAASLLYSENLAHLLARAREQYDMVLIDTPPMLQTTDARIIGRLGDGIILVARSERTTRDAMIAANQRFSEDRIPVLGTVLNDWNPKTAARKGYYTNWYGHLYTSYGEDTSSQGKRKLRQ